METATAKSHRWNGEPAEDADNAVTQKRILLTCDACAIRLLRVPALGVAVALNRGRLRRQYVSRAHQWHDLLGKPLHLLELRAALQQQQAHTGCFELTHAIGDLLRCADKACTKPAVGDRVVLQRQMLIELRVGDSVLVVIEAR